MLYQILFNKLDDQLKMHDCEASGSTICVCFIRVEGKWKRSLMGIEKSKNIRLIQIIIVNYKREYEFKET